MFSVDLPLVETSSARWEPVPPGHRNAIVVEEIAEDPTRYLVLGADRTGNLLELVVLDRSQGPAVIHAMPMTAQYRDLLPEGW